jgi:very-short-patch-repair endonuclease
LCARHGLPTPRTNLNLFGRERDAVFTAEKVIVEIDPWPTHKGYRSFEADRERDTIAAEHGYLTIRLTTARLINNSAHEAARLRRILERRRLQAA